MPTCLVVAWQQKSYYIFNNIYIFNTIQNIHTRIIVINVYTYNNVFHILVCRINCLYDAKKYIIIYTPSQS